MGFLAPAGLGSLQAYRCGTAGCLTLSPWGDWSLAALECSISSGVAPVPGNLLLMWLLKWFCESYLALLIFWECNTSFNMFSASAF